MFTILRILEIDFYTYTEKECEYYIFNRLADIHSFTFYISVILSFLVKRDGWG